MKESVCSWYFAATLVAAAMIIPASAIPAAERLQQQAQPLRMSVGSDQFNTDTLDNAWSFDDPNGNDAFSLIARPGWLQMRVNGSDEDCWENTRGGAPILHRNIDATNADFSVETYVDLASANGGYPVINSIGGLVVCQADGPTDAFPFLLSLGIQHNWEGGTEVILQKPGHSFKWAGPGANAVYLRLDRNPVEGTWSGYYRIGADSPWILLASVSDQDLPAEAANGKQKIGLFAKTWDPNLGGPARVDFAYFGKAESLFGEETKADSRLSVNTSQDVDVASLKPFCVAGKERSVLNKYHEAEILRHNGKGCLTHMWFGGDWPGYHHTRIRVYVDGEGEPSIDMELGLGHGCGFGDNGAPWGGAKLGKTGHPSGLYNTYKIPFGECVRVTAQRAPDSPDGAPFWWIVRGTENLPVRLAGVRLPNSARLKLHKLNGHVAKALEEFALCDVKGAGALYQVTMAADGLRDSGDWKDISYLEAIVRAYVNGEPRALQLSSGLEDYFLGTYYFNRGRYANDLAGLTHLDTKKNTFSAYRFHDDDPLFFQSGLKLTCRCGEELNGRKLHDPPDTEFTTYAWVYQW